MLTIKAFLKLVHPYRILVLCDEGKLSTSQLKRILRITHTNLVKYRKLSEQEGYMWFLKKDSGRKSGKVCIIAVKDLLLFQELIRLTQLYGPSLTPCILMSESRPRWRVT